MIARPARGWAVAAPAHRVSRIAASAEDHFVKPFDAGALRAKLEKIDDMTVRFTLNQVDAAFVQNLAMSFASIQSAEYADQLLKAGKASDINQKPIGTGVH